MRYEKLIKDKNIDCDYKKRLSCVYSLEDERKMIKEEKSAQELGVDTISAWIPSCRLRLKEPFM